MSNNPRVVRCWRSMVSLGFVICMAILLAGDMAARQQTEPTRRLWDSEFIKKSKQTAAKAPPDKRKYRIATPQIPVDRVEGDTVIGITLWRLRPSVATDDKQVRILKHKKDKSSVVEWTPERISVDTPLAAGQRLRLSIEAARTGYLYVIDREQFADGSLGKPLLIFPTLSIQEGKNEVRLGRVIDIPPLEDGYFELEQSRPDQTGEIITLLVTSKPVSDLKISEDAIELPTELIGTWEKAWGGDIGRVELEGTSGKIWTPEEKAASSVEGKLLKYDGPLPQTLYYRPNAKPDEPLLMNVRLRYGKGAPTPRHKK
jgi:hypothetical protein